MPCTVPRGCVTTTMPTSSITSTSCTDRRGCETTSTTTSNPCGRRGCATTAPTINSTPSLPTLITTSPITPCDDNRMGCSITPSVTSTDPTMPSGTLPPPISSTPKPQETLGPQYDDQKDLLNTGKGMYSMKLKCKKLEANLYTLASHFNKPSIVYYSSVYLEC